MTHAAMGAPPARPTPNRSAFWPILNIVALIIMIAVNIYSNVGPINNQTSADISNRYLTNFTPDNWAFSIWGIVWIGLIAFVIYQALPAQRANQSLQRLNVPFIVTCAANALWLVSFQYNQFWLSTVIMVILLGTLIVIDRQLFANSTPETQTRAWRWCVRVPFGIYLGWICVATIANFALTFVSAGWKGAPLTEAAWAIILLAITAVLAVIFLFGRRNIALVAVFVWAYTAIVTKHTVDAPSVSLVAEGLAIVFAIGIIIQAVRMLANRSDRPHLKTV